MSAPLLFAVSRQRGAGRFTYVTPHWPDARAFLAGLLAEAGVAGAPAEPPEEGLWATRVGECRYELVSRTLVTPKPAPVPALAGAAP